MAATDEPLTFLADEDFADEPHGSSRYHNFAMALKANLGMWALYPTQLKSPAARASQINTDAFGALPCYDFEAKMHQGHLWVRYYPEELRENTTRSRRRDATAPPQPTTTTSGWAAVLFDRVGPERADVVYRVLSKIFHPDMPTGDESLQRELNQARRPAQGENS